MGALLDGAEAPQTGDAREALASAYLDERTFAATSPPPASDPEAIAAELRLTPQLTTKELVRIRREFALANHPDRVAPGHRDLATRRMTLANALIDRALQDKGNQPAP